MPAIKPVVGRAYSVKTDNNRILHVIVDEIDGDDVVVHNTATKRKPKIHVKAAELRREITTESTKQLAARVNGESEPETSSSEPAPATTSSRKREPLTLPSGVTPRKIVLDFLKARATNDIDAGGQARPFITHTGKVVIHAKWLRDYLIETIDPNATTSDAVTMLRDLGYADRSVAVVGAATKNLSVWMADAPSGTGSIPRMSAPERKTKS
jgi:hypothetical protein